MFRYLPLIWKSSMRNRRRSALTVGSMAVSFCLLGVLLALYHALFSTANQTPAQALRLITHNRAGLAAIMPISYGGKIRKVPGVRDVTVSQWFGGVYKDARSNKNFFGRFSVEPEHFFNVFPNLQLPAEQKAAFLQQRTGCIAAKSLADKFGWKVGGRIPLLGDIFPVNLELTLVGIYTDPDNGEALFFNEEYLRQSLAETSPMRDIASTFELAANTPEDVPRVSRAIDAMFENSPAPTKTESERAFQLSFVGFLGNLKLFLMAICGAVTFTILLVSANTISMSVRERVREVGILKTLGFTPGSILGMVLGESAVIALLGGGGGILLADGLCWVLSHGPNIFGALRGLSPGIGVSSLSLAVALLVGIVSSLPPAWSASRTSILDSLRYAG